jgi:hypothetical protein
MGDFHGWDGTDIRRAELNAEAKRTEAEARNRHRLPQDDRSPRHVIVLAVGVIVALIVLGWILIALNAGA